jgi:methyl-accepting chemotaxis protein
MRGANLMSVCDRDTFADAVRELEKSIELGDELPDDYAMLDIDGFDVQMARSDHLEWRKRLIDLLAGRLTLDPAELADHHKCRFGLWYDSCDNPLITEHFAFSKLQEPHHDVHHYGIDAATRFLAGDLDGALMATDKVVFASKKMLGLLAELGTPIEY